MKLLIYLLLASLFVSCANNTVSKNEQEKFDSLIVDVKNKIYNAPNDIVERQIIKSFSDTINKLNINIQSWNGIVENIHETNEFVGDAEYRCLTFDVIRKTKDCEITFSCLHLINPDSIKYDNIYDKVVKLYNLQSVVFCGKFRENSLNTALYNCSYPEFNIIITNINGSKNN